MSSNNEKSKVDEMGIRLAPAPMKAGGINLLPSVRQDFVLRPSLEIDEPLPEGTSPAVSTSDDYQPKRKDVDKHWKRKKRTKNVVCGLIMLIFSAAVFVPYILAATNVEVVLPIAVVPNNFNVIGNLIEAVKLSIAQNWAGSDVETAWKQMMPDLILLFGLLFILANLIKSLIGIFGAVRVQRYFAAALIYFLCIAALLIAAVVGAEDFGIAKINFMNDIVHGWNSSEIVGIAAVAVANIVIAAVCSIINPEKSGYTK